MENTAKSINWIAGKIVRTNTRGPKLSARIPIPKFQGIKLCPVVIRAAVIHMATNAKR